MSSYDQGQWQPQGQPQPPSGPFGPPVPPPGPGYPQQPPQAGYGYPQQPAPFPAQAGYGGYPPPPPPRRKGGVIALVVALVVIGVVLLVGGGIVAFALLDSGGSVDASSIAPTGTAGPASSSASASAQASPSGAYVLSPPTSLPGGYQPLGKPIQPKPDAVRRPGFTGMHADIASSYQKSSGEVLDVNGSYGTIQDVPTAGDWIATLAANTTEIEWAQPLAAADARDPHDPVGELACGTGANAKGKLTLCAWADHFSVAYVSFYPSGSATPISPTDAAAQTRAIRDAFVVAKQ